MIVRRGVPSSRRLAVAACNPISRATSAFGKHLVLAKQNAHDAYHDGGIVFCGSNSSGVPSFSVPQFSQVKLIWGGFTTRISVSLLFGLTRRLGPIEFCLPCGLTKCLLRVE